MHKSAKSTSQKHKTKVRSNSDIENDSVVVSDDYDLLVEYENLEEISIIQDISSNIRVMHSDRAKFLQSIELPAISAIQLLASINGKLAQLKSQIYDHITANVSFDKTLSRWIAICDQLKISTHAEDMDSLVANLEDLLNKHDSVADNYQLFVNFNKFVSKDCSRFKKIPTAEKIGDSLYN
ncbi:hypothetical protein, partial [Acinetobacter oleivorans]|uniref:hypothetical protein n=1 Tax=Acinetobacter oleivorans TaxID=1148157 RepID=UPI00157FFB19